MRVLVTRPIEDAVPLMAALARMGHEGVVAPLLDIHLIDGEPLDLNGVQALLFTSSNGARTFAARSHDRDLPALCVGDATAREAFALGFEVVKSASGDVDALAALAIAELDPALGVLLHPAGSRVAGDLAILVQAAGFVYRRDVLYRAVKTENLPEAAVSALTSAATDGVLLFSPRTGAAFARLIDKADLREHLRHVSAYCLSSAVAEEIKALPWKKVFIAKHPDQASLLALLDT